MSRNLIQSLLLWTTTKATALLYSLIESAKANQIEPYAYLYQLFRELPYAQSTPDYQNLLPHRIQVRPLPYDLPNSKNIVKGTQAKA